MVKDIAIGAIGLGFNCRASEAGHCLHRCFCAGQALSRGGGPRHLLDASTDYRECNEDLNFFDFTFS